MTLKAQQFVVNMGPQHPSTHGVFRVRLLMDGETIVDLEPVFGGELSRDEIRHGALRTGSARGARS